MFNSLLLPEVPGGMPVCK